jgi:hypothetical protein
VEYFTADVDTSTSIQDLTAIILSTIGSTSINGYMVARLANKTVEVSDTTSLKVGDFCEMTEGKLQLRPDSLALIYRHVFSDAVSTIAVRTLTGKVYNLSIPFTNNIEQLKGVIQDNEGIPVDQQRIIFGGVQMEDRTSLEGAGAVRGAEFALVLRLRGD